MDIVFGVTRRKKMEIKVYSSTKLPPLYGTKKPNYKLKALNMRKSLPKKF